MRKLIVVMLLSLVASSAAALNIDSLLSTIAMPLAVDAVSNVSGVQQRRLSDFVSALDQANVPPAQVVEVVRYVPVALVQQQNQSVDIVQFVRDQSAQGVTGDALVNAIVQQLSSNYNVTPQLALNAPVTEVVEQPDYIPSDVLSRLGVSPSNPLAVIALPLAVAAVSDIAGVPQDQLANLVATLDNANMAPAQEIQIIRYVPVALVDNGPQFVQFVQQQTSQGITGPALVPVVQQQLQTYYPAPSQVQVTSTPEPVFTPEPPPVVMNRVVEVRQHPMHPHGGPPGLVKKELGEQTGAQVVHGQAPQVVNIAPQPQPARVEEHHGHGNGREKHGRAEEARPMISAAPPAPPVVVPVPQAQPGPVVVPGPGRGHGRGPEGGGPPGQEKEHGNGNGKGHGKD